MRQIKLASGKVMDLYSIYSYNDRLSIELLNTTLVEVEKEFTEEAIASITVLNANGEVDSLHSGYINIINMGKKSESISNRYLEEGGDPEEYQNMMVCTITLKETEDFKKQLELANKQIEGLRKSQSELATKNIELAKENEELKNKISEVDEMVAVILMNSISMEEEEVTKEVSDES